VRLQALSSADFAALAEKFITANEDDGNTTHDEHPSTGGTNEKKGNLANNSRFRSHQRTESLHVKLSRDDVQRIAREIYDQTVADVNLSLFSYWINESDENYQEAKRHIRELGLDHVSVKSCKLTQSSLRTHC
jgi:hypothetical protein